MADVDAAPVADTSMADDYVLAGNPKTSVYRMLPAADNSDPRWDVSPGHGEVLVRACSPADARIIAAESEADFAALDARPSRGVVTRHASAFRDLLLYHVEEDASGSYPADGPRGVLSVGGKPLSANLLRHSERLHGSRE
jgi:hypothetical protein